MKSPDGVAYATSPRCPLVSILAILPNSPAWTSVANFCDAALVCELPETLATSAYLSHGEVSADTPGSTELFRMSIMALDR